MSVVRPQFGVRCKCEKINYLNEKTFRLSFVAFFCELCTDIHITKYVLTKSQNSIRSAFKPTINAPRGEGRTMCNLYCPGARAEVNRDHETRRWARQCYRRMWEEHVKPRDVRSINWYKTAENHAFQSFKSSLDCRISG
ncbi:hypothetical protein J6590_049887 [Homalodisca vitripennis]|nr:hypothetical protein J6590_049887 [Homalodisca vitripennis]